jgi:hypothetical protein
VVFNQPRRGVIGQTELLLALLGCHVITERARRAQTQGKNERSHQALIRFLDAHAPKSLKHLFTILVEYRQQYTYRRRHQALKIDTTYLAPGQASEAGEHRGTDGTPIDVVVVEAAVTTCNDRDVALVAAVSREVKKEWWSSPRSVLGDRARTGRQALGTARGHGGDLPNEPPDLLPRPD